MTLPYVCLNCDEEVTLGTAPKLYCSEGCSQEAELVRYVRGRTKDGRIHEPDVAEAIQIRLAAVMAGGYPKQARCIPPKIRAAVIARDNGQCRACGGPGTEIDHINGSSEALENLQLLCDPCHNKKTMAGMVVVHPEDEKLQVKSLLFWARVEAEQPMRICDDEENWSGQWRRLMSEREDELARLVEDKIKNGRPMTKQEKRYWDLLCRRSMSKEEREDLEEAQAETDWERDYPEEAAYQREWIARD